jgi:hypothetical protein
MNYSIVTSFNNRLYNNKHQHVVKSVLEKCLNADFYVYNENSFLNEDLHIDGATNLDLFKQIPDLKNFLETSKFKDCHKIGKKHKQDYWNDPNKYLANNDHWNRNSIFWFRKVCAIYDCAKICKTPIMIWLDSDICVDKGVDQAFLNFVERYDFCGHFRKNFTGWKATDSGIMSFNLNKNCRFFIEKLMEHFLSGEVFKNKRWDDGYVFDVMTYKCRDWLRCCGFTKIFGCDFNLDEYFFHDKGWTTAQG